MLTVHHLNQSRSQRILWALEELALPYQIVRYQREKTMLAPPALKKVHPLGKSPVIEDHGMVIAESGAILEYLQETYDSIGRFKPADAQGKQHYRFWLHYAEGSLMPLLLMRLLFTSLGKRPVPFGLRTLGGVIGKGAQKAYLNPQLETHTRFIDGHLANHPWFAGEQLSMADIQMSFPLFALLARGGIANLDHISAWKARVERRPAWQRAIQQGGPFTIPGG
ncbi:glutathione S-transferase [Salmonella enterica]|uniref:glutathione transferase n=1 Tax=Salmonella enterica subsp. VII serovar 40:z4,z24:[z39] TaxID=1967625 RepID=A0A731TF20_SALEE|nr:glutathione S-transferase [Salmonella enterica]EDO5295926.1 glutathione S-transferase [Salmonella enterica subsp. houtenae serovar 40:z4,z24:-]EDS6440580.1 glutathione S-transferase [Salmonella enterica subsp. VII str. CFSAN000550]EDT6885540.1 glutathione S-transferase [Salmonella enterica subsp. enterica]EDU7901093.1 glutathione S-transferase [Salmonella enterica subsp. houtenae]QJY67304.1 glutathione S-transferase [Salmonella enterica subsp. VII serovar 1,40:g,z51:--]QUZ23243.1 glutathio